jgi:hypothetical protein
MKSEMQGGDLPGPVISKLTTWHRRSVQSQSSGANARSTIMGCWMRGLATQPARPIPQVDSYPLLAKANAKRRRQNYRTCCWDGHPYSETRNGP